MVPAWLTAFYLRIKALFRRRQLDRDLDDELQFHLAMREENLAGAGVTPDEAYYAARPPLTPIRRLDTNKLRCGPPLVRGLVLGAASLCRLGKSAKAVP
jgi:hypothetical protein